MHGICVWFYYCCCCCAVLLGPLACIAPPPLFSSTCCSFSYHTTALWQAVPNPTDKITVLKDMIFPQCEKLGQTIIFVRTREMCRRLHREVLSAVLHPLPRHILGPPPRHLLLPICYHYYCCCRFYTCWPSLTRCHDEILPSATARERWAQVHVH